MKILRSKATINLIVLLLLLSWRSQVQSQEIPATAGGFDGLRQADISFENLPINAPEELVAVMPSPGMNFVLSPDDRWLLLAEGSQSEGHGQVLSAHKLKLIDTRTWKQVDFSPVRAGRDRVSSFRVVFSPNGQLMLTVCKGSHWEHSLQLWSMTGERPELTAFFHISARLNEKDYYSWRHLQLSSAQTNVVSNNGEVLISGRDRTALLSVQGNQLKIAVDAPVGGEYAIASKDFKQISFLKSSGEIWEYGVRSKSLIGIRKSRIAEVDGGGRLVDLQTASVHPYGHVFVAIDSKRGACHWTQLGQAASEVQVLTDPLSRSDQRVYGRRAMSCDGNHFTLTDSDGKRTVTDVYDQSGEQVLVFTHKLPVEHYARVLPTRDRRHLLVSDCDDTTGYRLLIYRVSER